MTYTPLKTNVLSSFLQNTGLNINPNAVSYMGASTAFPNYSMGTCVGGTVLRMLTYAINVGYSRGLSPSTYNPLISIGSNTIPVLGNSKPPTYTNTYSNPRSQWGWLRCFPLLAHQEFHPNESYQYNDFLSTFTTCHGKMVQLNEPINVLNKSLTYLDGVYSNMNDLVTADITGVSLSTLYWGQDLIRSGRAIDLSTIDTFGSPDNLLKTLYKNRAITSAVNVALLAAGLTATDISNIINGVPATVEQKKLIFASFCLIQNQDLADTLIPLNCQTQGLTCLADLLDPKMLFPNSNTTLTYPRYNAVDLPTNSKTYYLIYSSKNSVDIKSGFGIGERLKNILPADIAYACDAFSISMLQIRNIQNMNIEKFSQVVANLETMKGLNGINGTSVPTNVGLSNSAIPLIAKGTGKNGLYTFCDYFGCMTDLKYPWQTLQGQISNLQTSTLYSIYEQLYLAVSWQPATISLILQPSFTPPGNPQRYVVSGVALTGGGGGYGRGGAGAPVIIISNGAIATCVIGTDPNNISTFGKVISVTLLSQGTPTDAPITATIQSPPLSTPGVNSPPGTSPFPTLDGVILGYISSANNEIASIQAAKSTLASETNDIYSNIFGTGLKKEEDARALALPTLADLQSDVSDTLIFVDSIQNYSKETEVCMTAQVLDNISDYATIGGNSLVGSLREARNGFRLALTGAEQDNKINGTAEEEIVNKLPRPNNTTISENPIGGITNPVIPGPWQTNPDPALPGQYGLTYPQSPGLSNIPIPTGASIVPGSFGGSDESTIIPDNFSIYIVPPGSSVLTPTESIESVILCNCDCWDNLE